MSFLPDGTFPCIRGISENSEVGKLSGMIQNVDVSREEGRQVRHPLPS